MINVDAILSAILILGAICLCFGFLIAVANKRFYVWEDPRIDGVEALLPGSNCGACASPGCRAFAEALVNGTEQPATCTVLGSDERDDVASFLGVDAGAAEKRIARINCAGGRAESPLIATYRGFESCKAASQVAGGGKGCTWGCLGLSDCAYVCNFGAISMNDNGLPVVDSQLCTACGDCVVACPKHLIKIQPLTQELLVQCMNQQHGDAAETVCSVACNACGKCVKDAPNGQIHLNNNLAVIDYDSPDPLSEHAIRRCPTRAIVWVDGPQFQPPRADVD